MEVWLEGMAMHLSVGESLPHDLEYDILNYTGRDSASEPSTPDVCSMTATPFLKPICESSPSLVDTSLDTSNENNNTTVKSVGMIAP